MAHPTLYEYYTNPKLSSGLSADQPHFSLNNKNISIYSGAMHYFRVPPEYWRDRLRKIRAAGLNCVETYIPWNLHEPEKGCFDFGQGGTDFQQFLNVANFLKIAQEEDLLAIVRPGPYICAEWEFGGLPSWLLREEMRIRTSDKKFLALVKAYFGELLKILANLQFTRGGPIVAFQIENEYGNTKVKDAPIDTTYLEVLREILAENNITELLFTSDTPSNGFWGTLPHVLATANFQDNAKLELGLLQQYQPNKPLMVMEYWTGWFDHWTEKHHTRSVQEFAKVLEEILHFGASVNMYMFHGGTNWGLLNGANIKDALSTDNSLFQPDITSYDYDAPLTEAGNYTEKYYKVKELISKFNKIETKIPQMPEIVPAVAYGSITVTSKIPLGSLLKIPAISNSKLVSMELLPVNNNNGQSYGYVTYRTKVTIPPNATLKIEGHVCDTVLLLVNGVLKSKILQDHKDLNSFGYWRHKDSSIILDNKVEEPNATIDLIVENYGRVNYGKLKQFNQFKGLWQGNVLLNDEILQNWDIFPLEFKRDMLDSLDGWSKINEETGPAFYKAILNINSEIRDTYVYLKDWNKGVIVVNGFVLARYLKLGPQLTAYLPAPLLRKGENTVLIFEHFVNGKIVEFINEPIYQ